MGKDAARQDHVFEFSGGALCLDFTNTVGDRPWGKQEHLLGYGDLLSWSRQAGILEPAEVGVLDRHARRHRRDAEAMFHQCLDLRECLYRMFSALADDRQPPAADLSTLNEALARALTHLRVEPGRTGFDWAWSAPAGALDRMLWPVIRSAADLLTSEEAGLVRQCDGRYCSWLFVDRSRNHRRRWCDMKVCGNRAKARRHYARKKKQA